MPVVPQYRIPGVAPASQPGAFQPVPAGTGVGAALRDAGQGIATGLTRVQLAQDRLQEERDKQGVVRAHTAVRDAMRSFLSDPETGILHTQKLQAEGATNRTAEVLNDVREKETAGFNDRQQQIFGPTWATYSGQTLDRVSNHEAEETRAAKADNTKATIATAIQDAATHYGAEVKGSRHKTQLDQIIAEAAFQESFDLVEEVVTVNGAGIDSPEVISETLAQVRSAMRKAQLDQIAVNEPARAKKYYDDHEEEFLGTEADDARRQVQGADIRGRGELLAVQHFDPQKTIPEMRKAVSASDESQKVKDEAMVRIGRYKGEVERMEEKRLAGSLQAAWEITRQEQSTDGLTPQMRDDAAGKERAAMEEYAAKLREGEPIVTDWGVHYMLNRMAAQDSTAFMEYRLDLHRAELSDQDFRSFSSLQRSMIQSQEPLSVERAVVNEVINQAATAAGLNLSPEEPGDEDSKRIYELYRGMWAAIGAEQPQTRQEVEAIADRLLGEGHKREPSFWRRDPLFYGFELGPGESFYQEGGTRVQRGQGEDMPAAVADAYREAVPEVPPEITAEIVDALRDADPPVHPTPARVRAVYRKAKASGLVE